MIRAMLRVLRHPSISAFESERANANLGRAILLVASLGLMAGFIGGSVNVIFAGNGVADIFGSAIETTMKFIAAFIAVQGFLYGALRLIGGKSNFETQAYLGSLVFAPCAALASLADIPPGIGTYLAALILLYQIVFTDTAMRAAHGKQINRIASFIFCIFSGFLGWFVISVLPL
jgi:hypothetical protein